MLTANEAADIAIEAGLAIGDAVALRSLADDPDSAKEIAAKFAATDEQRAISGLFGQDGQRTNLEVLVDGDDPETVAAFFSGSGQ